MLALWQYFIIMAVAAATRESRTAPRQRRTQEERSAAMRERLLDAAVECLIELGYAGTTTTEVARRAAVSRGAQLHHFPTKAELLTSAIEHLALRRGEELMREAQARLSQGDRISAGIDLLWSSFSGPLFAAAIELWIAARTDEELRAALLPVERRIGKHMLQLFSEVLVAGSDDEPSAGGSAVYEGALRLTIHMMRGMALAGLLKSDTLQEQELLESWKWMVTQLLESQKV